MIGELELTVPQAEPNRLADSNWELDSIPGAVDIAAEMSDQDDFDDDDFDDFDDDFDDDFEEELEDEYNFEDEQLGEEDAEESEDAGEPEFEGDLDELDDVADPAEVTEGGLEEDDEFEEFEDFFFQRGKTDAARHRLKHYASSSNSGTSGGFTSNRCSAAPVRRGSCFTKVRRLPTGCRIPATA